METELEILWDAKAENPTESESKLTVTTYQGVEGTTVSMLLDGRRIEFRKDDLIKAISK